MCTPVLLKNAHKLFKCVSRVNADIDVELRLECGATYSMTRQGPAAGEGTPRRIMSIIRKAKMTLACRCKLTLSGNTSAMGFSVYEEPVESANDSVEDCDDDSVKSANDSVEDCDNDSVALANDCHGAKALGRMPRRREGLSRATGVPCDLYGTCEVSCIRLDAGNMGIFQNLLLSLSRRSGS